MKADTSSESGFTLIEVLVAFTIVTLVLVAAMQLFSSSAFQTARVEEIVDGMDSASNALALSEVNLARWDPKQRDTAEWRVSIGKAVGQPVPWTTLRPHIVRFDHRDQPDLSFDAIMLVPGSDSR
jgi:prepilin-type N-terminal cleavage/methylation domain-containing protein